MVDRLGLTGVQFINVRNGCAAGGSALFSAQMAIKSGEFDLGLAVGFDKHPHGAFNALPSEYRSEEHTSALQSLMRNSYAVFCLKTKIRTVKGNNHTSEVKLQHKP